MSTGSTVRSVRPSPPVRSAVHNSGCGMDPTFTLESWSCESQLADAPSVIDRHRPLVLFPVLTSCRRIDKTTTFLIPSASYVLDRCQYVDQSTVLFPTTWVVVPRQPVSEREDVKERLCSNIGS